MNKTTLITGASRGIGAATAQTLARQGHNLCINFRRDEAAAIEVLNQVRGLGVNAMIYQADIADEEQVVTMFKAIDDQLGTLTGLVNNAGMLAPQMRVAQMSAKRLNQMLTTNVTSYFLCCREAIKRMSNQYGGNGGAIVNVSSAASRLGGAGEYVDYAASKGAIDTLTKGLATEVAGEQIRVNAVRPGFIYTDIHKDGGEPGRVDRVKDSLPLKRGGTPEEVANAISWLLSDEASYCTGSFIDVAGGR